MNHPPGEIWQAIDRFPGWAEFDLFQSWLDSAVQEGRAAWVPVQQPWSNVAAFPERWIRNNADGAVWRLVEPDPPFAGLFKRVADAT